MVAFLLATLSTCCFCFPGSCPDHERTALSHFKRALLDPYDLLGSWNGLYCCSWKGITCNLHTGHVVGLSVDGYAPNILYGLSVRNSSSPIFHGLLQLQHLEYLDLTLIDFHPLGIPSELAMLHRLTHLSLLDCGFTGRIPSFIGNMSTLKYLDVSQYNGGLESWQLGEWIGNLRGLEYLGLADVNLTMGGDRVVENIAASLTNLSTLYMNIAASLTNLSPLVNLTSLSSCDRVVGLDLSNNSLSGIIPPSLHNLSSLQALYLDDNKFHGTFLLSRLQNLIKISSLYLSNNFLTVIVDGYWIPKFQLHYLSLISCNMQGDFPAFISTQYAIRHLDLSTNNLGGDIPNWLWELIFLKTLNLASNQFWGSLLSSKFTEFDARSVDLHGNKLQGSIALPHPNVEFLDLSKNLFHRFIPAEIGKHGQYLRFLSLAKNNLSGGIPHHICEGHMLEVLDMSNNKLAGNIHKSFGNCSSTLKVLNLENNLVGGEIRSMVCLQTLKLGGNRLEGQIPPSLKNCSSLEILDLGYNSMQGEIPNWIEKLTSLRILVLRSNKFEGGIPIELSKLQNLQVLIFSNNTFSGNIPCNFGNLKAMINNTQSTEVFQYSNSSTTVSYIEKLAINNKGQILEYERSLALLRCLDLSNNNFSGDIPMEIGFLFGLKVLDLSRNQLSGRIPNSFEKLLQLESLDLSRNNLTRVFPMELQRLTFLSYLNISYNNFSGRIPQGGQLLTFNASSLSNNGHLCGLQINISCSSSSISPNSTNDDEDTSEGGREEHIWWEVGLGLSFGIGFGVTIGVLCFNKKCRSKCFKIMDDIIFIVDETIRK